MASTLSRLFRYAKSVEIDAFENFATEALAHAVRSEPAPLFEALRAAGLRLPETDAVTGMQVISQKSFGDAGIVDLVVNVETARDAAQVWVEVKWNAPEHGAQLANYATAIAALPDDARPALVVLAPRRIDTSTAVPIVLWSALWRAARGRAHWKDLRIFLEEHGMANQFDTTTTAREASAQGDAFALFKKTENVVVPAIEHAKKVAPLLKWPDSKKKVRRFLSKHFGEWGAMTVGTRISHRFGIALGTYDDPDTRESWLGVRVWHDPKDTTARRAVLDLTKDALKQWEHAPVDDQNAMLCVYERLVRFATLEEMTKWLIVRLDELSAVGVLGKLVELKSAAAPEDEEDEDD